MILLFSYRLYKQPDYLCTEYTDYATAEHLRDQLCEFNLSVTDVLIDVRFNKLSKFSLILSVSDWFDILDSFIIISQSPYLEV